MKPIDITVGDTVLVKRPPHLGKGTAYEEMPMKVVARKGTMITASSGERDVTRNASFFKPFEGELRMEKFEDDDEYEALEKEPDKNEGATTREKQNEIPTQEVIPNKIPISRPSRTREAPVWMKDFVAK